MWWLARLAGREPGESWCRLSVGETAACGSARSAEAQGCRLTAFGFCTASDAALRHVAGQVASGDTAVLASLGGSRAALAVWSDGAAAVGDLAGQQVVFYARAPGDLVLGSHARRVASVVGGGLDDGWLAARLLVPELSDVWWPASPWDGVRALRPGWVLRVSRDGSISEVPGLRLAEPGDDLDTAACTLRHALVDAVGQRLRAASRPTVDLSGGLDSSTVALLAAREAEHSVPALTLAVEGVEDEHEARCVAASAPRLAHRLLAVPDSVLPYAELERVPVVDEPLDDLVIWARIRWWMGTLAEVGSDAHLTGDGGDAVLGVEPVYLADLARRRAAGALWRHAVAWARRRHIAPHRLLSAAVRLHSTSYATMLNEVARRLIGGVPAHSATADAHGVSWGKPQAAAAGWMTPRARSLVARRLRTHAEAVDGAVVPGALGVGDAAAWLWLNDFSRAHRLHVEMASACGIDVQAPYLDDGVVRACWSVAAWHRGSPLGAAKPLLVRALGDVLPEALARRHTKGDYSALVYRGLACHRRRLEELFAGSLLAERGLIDERAIRDVIRRGARGLAIPLGAFNAIVGAELWLRGHTTLPCGRRRP